MADCHGIRGDTAATENREGLSFVWSLHEIRNKKKTQVWVIGLCEPCAWHGDPAIGRVILAHAEH